MPDMADPRDEGLSDLLGLIGQVTPPAVSVLQAAREALWSAVADEALTGGGHESGGTERTAARSPGQSRRTTRPDPAQPGT